MCPKKTRTYPPILFLLCVLSLLSGCQQNSCQFEPTIVYVPPARLVEDLPSAFPPLSPQELRQDWGKELIIANGFALENDFYRAITGYKRALFLIPPKYPERRFQIEYGIMQSYYRAGKYCETIETFDHSTLTNVPDTFPAYDDLLIILQDSYTEIGQPEKACKILSLIESRNRCTAEKLELSQSLRSADFNCLTQNDPLTCGFLASYQQQAKSVQKAQLLNAILPGAGYLYVGQGKTALTSFAINALFIAAAYQFFHHGNVAAGIITASLETGWYFGGINGAGLAAKAYNECIYSNAAKELMLQERLFPILMLNYAF